MKTFKLAFRNLIGAGLRTWLNVFVLSLVFVVIIAHKGLLDGWDHQAEFDMVNWDVAGGQLWQVEYDPLDLFTITDSHIKMSPNLQQAVKDSLMTPILITQGTIYPEGRIQNAMIKGIDPNQKIVDLPSHLLNSDDNIIPAIIGTRMAKSNKLKIGDYLTIRWRDINGSFDATEVLISGIFKTNVPLVDAGQIYLSLDNLQQMLMMPNEASIMIIKQGNLAVYEEAGWVLRDKTYLLKEVKDLIKSKSAGGSVIYIMLLLLAMLAIFDTQVLSVFRRQKEIGTFIAMGMTRGQVIRMFTVEGAMYGFMATILAAIYGTPLLLWFRNVGLSMPESTDDFNMAVAESIIPYYSAGLIITTILVVLLTTTVVSFLPVRKISKMKPTDAIKGKLQ